MTNNLNVFSTTSTNVSVTSDNVVYLVTALASTTYNYTLPAITVDGQNFHFIRTDQTSGIVNLIGSIYSGTTLYASYVIRQNISITLISLGPDWYIVDEDLSTSIGQGNVFSAIYTSNSASAQIAFTAGSVILYFPFIGTSNGGNISKIQTTSIQDVVRLYRSDLTLIVELNIPNTFFWVTTLTNAQKALLPTGLSYLIVDVSAATDVGGLVFYA